MICPETGYNDTATCYYRVCEDCGAELNELGVCLICKDEDERDVAGDAAYDLSIEVSE